MFIDARPNPRVLYKTKQVFYLYFCFSFNILIYSLIFHFFSDNKVVDYRGRVIKHYPAIPTILEFLSKNNISISVASRNAVTDGAEKLIHLFGWNRYFQSVQIYPGRKDKHILM